MDREKFFKIFGITNFLLSLFILGCGGGGEGGNSSDNSSSNYIYENSTLTNVNSTKGVDITISGVDGIVDSWQRKGFLNYPRKVITMLDKYIIASDGIYTIELKNNNIYPNLVKKIDFTKYDNPMNFITYNDIGGNLNLIFIDQINPTPFSFFKNNNEYGIIVSCKDTCQLFPDRNVRKIDSIFFHQGYIYVSSPDGNISIYSSNKTLIGKINTPIIHPYILGIWNNILVITSKAYTEKLSLENPTLQIVGINLNNKKVVYNTKLDNANNIYSYVYDVENNYLYILAGKKLLKFQPDLGKIMETIILPGEDINYKNKNLIYCYNKIFIPVNPSKTLTSSYISYSPDTGEIQEYKITISYDGKTKILPIENFLCRANYLIINPELNIPLLLKKIGGENE